MALLMAVIVRTTVGLSNIFDKREKKNLQIPSCKKQLVLQRFFFTAGLTAPYREIQKSLLRLFSKKKTN